MRPMDIETTALGAAYLAGLATGFYHNKEDLQSFWRAERTFERGLNPAGVGRQLRAILASGSRKERLRAVKAPTLVIHGTVDPLVRPEGGKDTAASIPGAKLLMIEGMGHALPIPMWPQIIDAIDKHAHGAAAKAA